ncbi:hypothetical protein YC2023_046886 [Brassica napus]
MIKERKWRFDVSQTRTCCPERLGPFGETLRQELDGVNWAYRLIPVWFCRTHKQIKNQDFAKFPFHSGILRESSKTELTREIQHCWWWYTMGGVMQKFLVASMFMWILPVAILYGFNNDLLPGKEEEGPSRFTLAAFEIELNPENHYLKKLGRMFKLFLLGGTCASGFLAVVSVNVVIVFYICLALKEPTDKHKPDASFVAEAKDSVKKLTSGVPSTDPAIKKQE